MAELDNTHNGDLRTQILDAARHLMVKEGYANLSMRKIARSIGYSATSIYLHFSNKDELFFALIDEGMDKLHRVLSEAAEKSTTTALEQFKSVCRSFVDFGLDNGEYYEVMFVLHPDTGSRFPAEKYRKARRNIEVIEDAMKRGIDEGTLIVRDTYSAATSVWAMLHGVVTLLIARRVDRSIPAGQLISSVVDTIVRGFQPLTEPLAE